MAAFSKSGIKLSRIVAFVNIDTSLKKLEAEEGPYSSWRFGQDVVKKATDGKRAFVDNALLCDPQSAGPAAVFVCHAHKNRFQVLVDTLGDHFRKEEPCLWVDLFCMNQHDEEYRRGPLQPLPPQRPLPCHSCHSPTECIRHDGCPRLR